MRCNIIRTQRELEAQRATKKPTCRRWFGVVAMLIAFLLIVGSIYLHLRQKSHFGRLHFKQNKSDTNDNQIVATNSRGEIYDYTAIATSMPGVVADSPQVDTAYTDDFYDTEETIEEKKADLITKIIENANSEESTTKLEADKRNRDALNEVCLQCICETTTECKPAKCRDGPCGPFRISMPYWTDAALGDMTAADYQRCVNDDVCARRVVSAYMRKYARDCDGDGIVDCRDYIALHLQGPTGCRSDEGLPIIFQTRMESCFMSHEMLD